MLSELTVYKLNEKISRVGQWWERILNRLAIAIYLTWRTKARHSTMANAKLLDHGEFIHGLARRTTILRDWLQFLERYPAILMPVSWQLPFPSDHDQQGDAALGQLVRAHEPMTAISLLGLSGLSVPTGTSDGIPVGVQIVGNRFQEELCLSIGEVIEAKCPMETPIDQRP